MKAYHATYEAAAENILTTGFQYRKDRKKWPGDLGYGVYTYVDPDPENDLTFEYPARQTSYLFVSNGKTQRKDEQIKVLELCIKDEINLLNLTDPIVRNEVISLKNRVNKLYVTPERLQEYDENLDKERNQQDGIFFEYMIENILPSEPDAVISDTFAVLDKTGIKSNFPNGRELCIRNLNIILKTSMLWFY